MEQAFRGIRGFSKFTVMKLVASYFTNQVDQLLYASKIQSTANIITHLPNTAQPFCLIDRTYSGLNIRLGFPASRFRIAYHDFKNAIPVKSGHAISKNFILCGPGIDQCNP